LIWLAAVILAVFVSYASSVIVNQGKAPAQVYGNGFWDTGTAEANFAYALFAARQRTDLKAVVSNQERRLAEHAYRSEPLSTAALGLVIASMTEPREDDIRRRLLGFAGKLTRRSSIITSASVEAAARADDRNAFFLWLSRGILTNEKLRSIYIDAMSEATAMDGSVEALTSVLGRNPAWAQNYWSTVATRPNSLENATALRIALIRPPWNHTAISATDRRLATRLVTEKHFDAARKLATAFELGGHLAPVRADLLVNGNFTRQPLLPPIDWSLATSGHLGASIDDKAHQMTISAIAGAYGWAARQLIELIPGEYDVEWSMESNASLSEEALSAQLICAEKDKNMKPVPPVPLVAGSHRSNFVLHKSDCRWYWFSIDAQVGDGSVGFDATLRRLLLSRRTS
jgi:hypothetical protein